MMLLETTHSSWTNEREETLRKLWKDGLSASQCAAHLGGTTRNAVISKVHRMGLHGRAHYGSRSQERTPPRKIRTVKVRKTTPNWSKPTASAPRMQADTTPIRDIDIPEHQRVTFVQLEPHHCKYPLGPMTEKATQFCGGKRHPGTPYCTDHCRIAYTAPQARAYKKPNVDRGRVNYLTGIEDFLKQPA